MAYKQNSYKYQNKTDDIKCVMKIFVSLLKFRLKVDLNIMNFLDLM